MLQESWMVGEIIILAMLENEDAAFVQKVTIQYEVWNLREFFQSVGWVGKDEIELLLAGSQKAKYIATNQKILVFAQFLEALSDKVGMVAVCLYADYTLATAGNQFQRDAACAGKEVEGCGILEVDVILQNIKDVLLCEIGGWSRLKRTGNVEMATLILSCYDSHIFTLNLLL